MAWSLHGLHGMPQGFGHLNGKLWYGKPPRLYAKVKGFGHEMKGFPDNFTAAATLAIILVGPQV